MASDNLNSTTLQGTVFIFIWWLWVLYLECWAMVGQLQRLCRVAGRCETKRSPLDGGQEVWCTDALALQVIDGFILTL